MGVGDKRHTPAALPPWWDSVPIAQEAGWAPGPVWTGAEILALTGIRSIGTHADLNNVIIVLKFVYQKLLLHYCWRIFVLVRTMMV